MNHIGPVKDVSKRMKMGYPEGVDTLSQRQIPILLARIEELERALVPFARIGVQLDSNSLPLVDCYAKDCKLAYEMVDETFSIQPPPVQHEIPATY